MNDSSKAREKSTMELVRDANAEIDSVRLKFKQQDAYFECVDEIQSLIEYAANFPEDDQRFIDTHKRINFLLSPQHQMDLNAKCSTEQKFSNAGRDLFLSLVGPLKMLLIVAFNIIALLIVLSFIF